MLRNYGAIMDVMLPTLGEERRQTYSPVLPISPESGKVLQVPVEVVDPEAGLVRYVEPETGQRVEQSILAGGAKLQWKVDWAMRWVALGVDYEMSGKDLIDSVTQSSKIARILGGRPPEGFNYEMFLDENGEKISKSKGNGLTIDEWLTYAPRGEPRILHLSRAAEGQAAQLLDHPQGGRRISAIPRRLSRRRNGTRGSAIRSTTSMPAQVPPARMPLSFALLLNLVGVASTDDKDLLWGFVKRYAPEASPETHPELDALIGYALAYFRDFVAGSLRRRPPDEQGSGRARATSTRGSPRCRTMRRPEEIQIEVYEVGKAAGFENLRDWFRALYETLLGTSQGPRMGSFFALYGIDNSRRLIAEALALRLTARGRSDHASRGCRETGFARCRSIGLTASRRAAAPAPALMRRDAVPPSRTEMPGRRQELRARSTTGCLQHLGQRPDGKPSGSWEFPLDLPRCPGNGLVIFDAVQSPAIWSG